MDPSLFVIVPILLFTAIFAYLTFDLISRILPIILDRLSFSFKGKPGNPRLFTFGKGLDSNEERTLMTRLPYYRRLNDVQKRVFSIRVKRFMKSKKFSTRQQLTLTHEMKLLVSATAVKVTYGFRNYLMNHFSEVIIYPSAYFSKATQTTNRGETHSSGIIVFSWSDFQEGHACENDSLNLGYHEFAHALYIEERVFGSNYMFRHYYPEWEKLLRDGVTVKRIREEALFRAYGTTNEAEFFAVAIENFFENPGRFHEKLPELYRALCRMLNQNPLNPNFAV